jgi:L-ascorbate metabolism protein UlaG (beta-lactamase superfamily)
MSKIAYPFALMFALSAIPGFSEGWAEDKGSDVFDSGKGEVRIVFLGHASLILIYDNAYFYIDPVSEYGNYSSYPKADVILVTHEHYDHLDPKAIEVLSKQGTRIILPKSSRAKLGKGELLEHGTQIEIAGVSIVAVPAYNVTAGRTNYHPKERRDNGYILSIEKLRVYIAGDTEPIPEMGNLGPIDIAFLPMNQPYTMTPEQVAAAVTTIRPKILYPYHFGSTDTNALIKLLKNDKETEVRIRKLQ